ncbi:unnamed protein product, partial [Mesorhabditis spiculigera]
MTFRVVSNSLIVNVTSRKKLALIRQKNRSNSTVPPTQDENSTIPKEQIDNQLEDKNKPYGTIELQASNNANDRILNPSQHPTLSDGKLKHQLPPEMTMVSNKPLNQIHRRSKLEKMVAGKRWSKRTEKLRKGSKYHERKRARSRKKCFMFPGPKLRSKFATGRITPIIYALQRIQAFPSTGMAYRVWDPGGL